MKRKINYFWRRRKERTQDHKKKRTKKISKLIKTIIWIILLLVTPNPKKLKATYPVISISPN